MLQNSLDKALVKDILDYLTCPAKLPTLRYINRLVYSYIRKVPWESVSRIVKRSTTLELQDCPRWPAEFWSEAIEHGFGGTCFESSLAFYSLLMNLGYEGYLTVNDMGDSRVCHAAIVIFLGGNKYLIDITIPLHSAVLIDPNRVIRRRTALQDYTIRPVQENKYEVQRSHHAHRYAFTLLDIPVGLPEYRTIMEDDYNSETGRFLKNVVIVKVVGNKTWRFFDGNKPYRLENFNRFGKTEIFIHPNTLSKSLSLMFQLPVEKISYALSLVQNPIIAFSTDPEFSQERSSLHA